MALVTASNLMRPARACGKAVAKGMAAIWMRFVASQMTPAVFDQTTIEVSAQGGDGANYQFRATGSMPKFDGFLERPFCLGAADRPGSK